MNYDMILREINFSTRNCPVCNSSGFDLLHKGDRHNIGLSNVICNTCFHIYVNPCPDDNGLSHFYKKYYRRLYNSTDHPDADYLNTHHPLKIGTNRNVGDILYIFN